MARRSVVQRVRRHLTSRRGLTGVAAREVDRSIARARRRRLLRAHINAVEQPVDTNAVLYESFSGNGALCSPEALFRELLAAPDLTHLHHYWVLDRRVQGEDFAAVLGRHPRVTVVTYRSARYLHLLETAKYLVNNATFPPHWTKRPEQVYLNTWHGTPLKKMGYDIPGGQVDARNVIRNFLSADWLLSANAFMTEQMYVQAYKLHNVFTGKIIEEGFPRTDYQFDQRARRETRAELGRRGLGTDGRKIILIAPTWRGASFYSPATDTFHLKEVVAELMAALPKDEYRVLVKVHQAVYAAMSADAELGSVLVPNDMPTNKVLAVTDLLISDYSSIFYDYLLADRPVLFHIPDLDAYEEGRGLYAPADELPGPVSRTISELVTNLSAALEPDRPLHPAHLRARERYCPYDDGSVSRRVIDIVFRGRSDGYRIRSDFDDGRETLLLYAGGMITNGITSSLLSLLNSIDYQRFDVSVIYQHTTKTALVHNIRRIRPDTRQFAREGALNWRQLSRSIRRRRETLNDPVDQREQRQYDELWTREWRRCMGQARFDHIIDFSGYGPFYPSIMLKGTGQTFSAWQHNDLVADSLRLVKDEYPHKDSLEGIFSLYPQFDTLVSVSPALRDINASRLGHYAGDAKFVSARNTLDIHHIRQAAGSPYATAVVDQAAQDGSLLVDRTGTADLTDLSSTLEALVQRYPTVEIRAELARRALVRRYMPDRATCTTFITVGRLSPEKNQMRLIQAFAQTHHVHPATRLVIVGSGPLSSELRGRAAELGVASDVAFTGNLSNPYVLLGAADCFVLSSDHEGQPMVILEARALGLPVISTAFDSVASAVPAGTGQVVACDDQALAEAMISFVDYGLPIEEFDAEAYNAEAIEEFYQVIGAARAPAVTAAVPTAMAQPTRP